MQREQLNTESIADSYTEGNKVYNDFFKAINHF